MSPTLATTLRALPALPNPDSSMWLDESIWGHRLHDEQSPWLAYLEFLNVLLYEDTMGRGFEEPEGPNKLSYRPAKRLYLRHILFNNPKLEEIRVRFSDENSRWAEWFKQVEGAKGLVNPRFDFLRKHFHSFDDFCEVVSLIRSTSLEISSNKRWTSKFVFPYGKDCLYEDLDNDAASNDRRFFGRTGEILYLMLCRSTAKAELLAMLREKYLKPDTDWNRLARCFQPTKGDADAVQRTNSFLPYESHACFDELAEDWISILKLGLPGFDAVPHLVNLAGLHLLEYQLSVASELRSGGSRLRMVCEVVAPRKTLVRELSCEHYESNNLLPAQAVESRISRFEASQEWQGALSGNGAFVACRKLLKETFIWGDDYEGPNDPTSLLAEFRTAALRRHRQHVANIHRNYGREIGLVSKRGTVKLRYAPNDQLLTTLLFANVEKRVELHQFLGRLYSRYGFIFGDKEAEQVLPKDEFDKKAFQANSRRLEQRLGSLGLLRRLSDGCAYVINPYSVDMR